MEAILLAGGFGTRLRPLTYTRPKPLLPVAGRPMLEWALDRLPPEVDHVVVAVNWLAGHVEAHFQATPHPFDVTVVREAQPLGTAGAVKNCAQHLDERFFVLNGDIVSTMDLHAMLGQHGETGAVGTIAVKEVPSEDVVHFGVVRPDIDDARRIRGFVEKPATPAEAPSRRINAGAYLLEPDVLDLIPGGRLVSMEKEIFPQLLDRGFYGWRFDGTWIDVGDPERLRAASQAMDGERMVGPGSTVAPDAVLEDTLAGARTRIGSGAVLHRCVLGDDVTVDAGSRVVDCVVGDGERVGGDLKGRRVWSRPVPEGYPASQLGNAMRT